MADSLSLGQVAGRKRAEVAARIEEARAMQRLLSDLHRCGCPTLATCADGDAACQPARPERAG